MATPWTARGLQEKGERLAVRKVRERDGISRSDLLAARQAVESIAPAEERPWEAKAAARLEAERSAYDDLARGLAFMLPVEPKHTEAFGELITATRRQAMALRLPPRREHMRAIAVRDDYNGRVAKGETGAALCEELASTYRDERERHGPYRGLGASAVRVASPAAMERKLAAFDAQAGEAVRDQAERGDIAAAAVRDGRERARRKTASWVEGRTAYAVSAATGTSAMTTRCRYGSPNDGLGGKLTDRASEKTPGQGVRGLVVGGMR